MIANNPNARPEPSSTPAERPGFFRKVGQAFKTWLGMYPGCGCKADACDPGDPMAKLPNTSPVEKR